MIEAINLCITVVAYASDSVRAMQMLVGITILGTLIKVKPLLNV